MIVGLRQLMQLNNFKGGFMKALFINGSPKKNGSTYTALHEIENILTQEGIECEYVHVPHNVDSCSACNYCHSSVGCVKKDIVNETYEKLAEADAVIVGSPVYYAGPSGSLISFLDRLFYSYPERRSLNLKAAACISNSRRAGNITSNDVISKFFSINGMTIITSTYWNDTHGNNPEEVLQDKEAMQTMSNLGRNIAYYLRIREAAKDIKEPEIEKKVYTNFIR